MRTIWAIILLMTFVGVLSAQDALQLSPPLISVDPVMFEDSARVRIDFGMKQSSLYYELDGEIALYTGPFYVTSSQHISASARANGFRESEKEHALAILASDVEIQLNESTSPSQKYPNDGRELTDGIKADNSFDDAGWCGFDSKELVFEWTSEDSIERIGLSYLSDSNSWILPPSHLVLEVFIGQTSIYKEEIAVQSTNSDSPSQLTYFDHLKPHSTKDEMHTYRLIAIASVLPAGHPGEGNPAWIFLDEILVNR